MELKDPSLTRARNKGNAIVFGALLLLILVGALVAYKATASLKALEKTRATGSFRVRADIVPPGLLSQRTSPELDIIQRSINYVSVIWPALLFGILISAAVRIFVPARWLAQIFLRGAIRPQVTAALAGVPLMLCSCCAAPIFSGVYERSSRLGPSLAVMIAAPALNPAALVLTFMLFESKVATVRLVMSIGAVFLTTSLADRLFGSLPLTLLSEPLALETNGRHFVVNFFHSCLLVARRTLPSLVLGILLSMVITNHLPVNVLSLSGGRILLIAVAAFFGVLVALPTFFEIPLALTLAMAGAPIGVATAVLIAGPAVNLPSLITILRATSWKVAGLVAVTIWSLAVVGGLLVS